MFKRLFFYISILLVQFLLVNSLFSAIQSKLPTSNKKLMDLDHGARPLAMGRTFCAIADDENSLYYNPAGLADINHIEIMFSDNQKFEGLKHQYLGLIYSFRDIRTSNIQDLGSIGIGFTAISDKDISIPIDSKDRIITAGYGKTIFKSKKIGSIKTGFNANFITDETTNGTIDTTYFDIGTIWRFPNNKFAFGLSIQNLGEKKDYLNKQFNLPLNIKFGGAYKLFNDKLLLGIDGNNINNEEFFFNSGCEFLFKNTIALRLGYDSNNKLGNGITTGLGLSFKEVDILFFYCREITIDYAFVPYDNLGAIHRISILLKLGAD